MAAKDAASRLRALPADATATEVLCAALGTDRRGLSTMPGGTARGLASLLDGACDADEMLTLARECEDAAGLYRDAVRGRERSPVARMALAVASDLEEVSRRVRAAVGPRG